MGCVTRVEGWESDGGTPVLEVRDDVSAVPFGDGCKMGVESREKFLEWVTRREESESDGGVGVALEVGIHRLKKS